MGGTFSGTGYDVTQTRTPDGKTETEITWNEQAGKVAGAVKIDAQGNTERYLISRNIPASHATAMNEHMTGQKQRYSGPQDMVLKVDDKLAVELVNRAKTLCNNPNVPPSSYITDLRNAENNAQVHAVLYRAAANGGDLFNLLAELRTADAANPLGQAQMVSSAGR